MVLTLPISDQVHSFFLKGLEKRAQLIGAERSDAVMISSKISHQLLDQMTASISGTDGLISDEKCSKLMITRISNSALTVPIQYVADIVHWIETMLQVNHQLFVHINECVCDFIKDDEGNWFFINLKSLQITPESHGRVRMWHQITTNPSSAAALMAQFRPRLSAHERNLKHEAELGILCKLCGLYYIEHSTIDVTKDRNNFGYNEESKDGVTITVVPAYGYSMTCFAAAIVASIYRSYQLPLTRHASYLLNNYSSHQEMHFRSVRQSSELGAEGKDGSVVGNGRGEGNANAKGSGGNSDIVICCYHCCTIYEKHLLLNRRSDVLYALLGIITHKEENSSSPLDKVTTESGPGEAIHTKSETGIPPRPKSAPSSASRRTLPFSPSLSHSQNQLRSSVSFNEEFKLKEKNGTIKSKLLQYWRDLTQASPLSPSSIVERCSFHALPRSAQHFRLLTMFHCMIFEDPSEMADQLRRSHDDNSPSINNPQLSNQIPTSLNPPTTLYNHCLIYQFGQQEVFIPFTISRETLKRDPSSHSYYLPIQECRIQHVLSKKEDLFQYLKQSKMRCYLLSYDEQRRTKTPNLFSKKSFNLQKSFEERKQERLAAFLLSRSNSSSRLSVPGSPTSPHKVDNPRDVIMNECEFEFSFHELKGYEKDVNVLSTGFAKFDLVIKVKSLHLSTVSFKISFAIQLDSELPTNLNTVRNFAVEDKKIYWPSADYYPKQSALPSTWLSMLLIPSTAFISAAALEAAEQKAEEEEEENHGNFDANSAGIVNAPSPHSLHKKKGKEEEGEDKRSKLTNGRRSSSAVKSTLIQNNPALRRSSQMISALSALSTPQLPNASQITNSKDDISSLSILPADKREKRSFMINKVTDAIHLKDHEFVISKKSPPSTVNLDTHTAVVPTPSAAPFQTTTVSSQAIQKSQIHLQDPKESEKKETQRIREFSSHYFSQSELLRTKTINIADGFGNTDSNSPTEKETNSNTGGRGSLVAGRRSLILNELYSAINQDKQLSTNTSQSNKDFTNTVNEREGESKGNRLTPTQILQSNEGYQRLIAFLEELFLKEEVQHQSGNNKADEDRGNERGREDEDEDEEDEYDDILLLKSKKIIDKLIIILKNIKVDYFQSNFVADNNSFPSSPIPAGRGTTSSSRPSLLQRQRSSDRLILSPAASFRGLRPSMRQSSFSNNSKQSQTQGKNSLLTFQTTKMKQIQQRLSYIKEFEDQSDDEDDEDGKGLKKKKGTKKTKEREEKDDEDEEEEDANSLDSDMNYISEDILNSMIYTLQYILVIDFLPRRIKWMTLKSLIFEYSPMFFTTLDKSTKIASIH